MTRTKLDSLCRFVCCSCDFVDRAFLQIEVKAVDVERFVMAERLQKPIAQAGIASRRHAEEMIKAGEVTVNGRCHRTGNKADPQKITSVRGTLINPACKARKFYALLNNRRVVFQRFRS